MPKVCTVQLMHHSRLRRSVLRAHWKAHKPNCLQTQRMLAAIEEEIRFGASNKYAVPTINNGKLLEDLRKWSKVRIFPRNPLHCADETLHLKHHRDWISFCTFQAARLKTGLEDFGRTHAVLIELDVHNTRQPTYIFTYMNASPVSFEELRKTPDAFGQPLVIEPSLEALKDYRVASPQLQHCLCFLHCRDVWNIVPLQYPPGPVLSMPKYRADEWPQVVKRMLMVIQNLFTLIVI